MCEDCQKHVLGSSGVKIQAFYKVFREIDQAHRVLQTISRIFGCGHPLGISVFWPPRGEFSPPGCFFSRDRSVSTFLAGWWKNYQKRPNIDRDIIFGPKWPKIPYLLDLFGHWRPQYGSLGPPACATPRGHPYGQSVKRVSHNIENSENEISTILRFVGKILAL